VRVANYASRAGPADIRVGPLTIARALGVGHVSLARRVTAALSPTGTAAVSARRTKTGAVVTASRALVLATRSVGLFALVPTTSGSRLIRLPYDRTPPTPTTPPAVTGTRRFDHTVSCGKGTWTPKASRITRRWTIDGVPVPGGSSLRLTTAAAAGHVVGCSVTASSRGMATRVRTTFALPSVPTPIVPPAILVPSELANGDDVSCDVGRWAGAPTDFVVRWVRIATQQVVGTGFTYTLHLAADNGENNVVACQVAAVNDGGPSVVRQSLNSVALNIPPTIAIRTGPTATVASTGLAFFTFAIGGDGEPGHVHLDADRWRRRVRGVQRRRRSLHRVRRRHAGDGRPDVRPRPAAGSRAHGARTAAQRGRGQPAGEPALAVQPAGGRHHRRDGEPAAGLALRRVPRRRDPDRRRREPDLRRR
jgi:hypothetical protein